MRYPALAAGAGLASVDIRPEGDRPRHVAGDGRIGLCGHAVAGAIEGKCGAGAVGRFEQGPIGSGILGLCSVGTAITDRVTVKISGQVKQARVSRGISLIVYLHGNGVFSRNGHCPGITITRHVAITSNVCSRDAGRQISQSNLGPSDIGVPTIGQFERRAAFYARDGPPGVVGLRQPPARTPRG